MPRPDYLVCRTEIKGICYNIISILSLSLHVSIVKNDKQTVVVVFYVQGKGTIISYFLNEKEGFTKPLPDLHDAALLSET